MRRALFLLPVALFLVLAAYFGLALTSGRDPHELPSAMIDKPAPAFTLAGLDGTPGLARASLGGQVAIVNFFASWCIPCRIEHPLLMRLSETLSVPVYGIAYKDRPEDAQQFLAQLGDPYGRVGLDESGRVGIDFGVYGVPETYVIDKAGRIRLRHVGPLTAEAVSNELAPLVKMLGRS
ncbi:MAG TPA: DsbE family thiol:disulfide interchange protein [Stellaceae bacterium]|nr:DsbE family thiol:disulfide interchange protein [Stellaceae bacterium]